MTFSLAGMCGRTGMFGAAVTTSSIGVGSRCPYARAGVGAVLTQHRTDPALGPKGLDLLARTDFPPGPVGKFISITVLTPCRRLARPAA